MNNNLPSAVFRSKTPKFPIFPLQDIPLEKNNKKDSSLTFIFFCFFYSSFLHLFFSIFVGFLSFYTIVGLVPVSPRDLQSNPSLSHLHLFLSSTSATTKQPPFLSARILYLLQLRLELAEAPWRLPIKSPDRNSSMSLSDAFFFPSPGNRASGSLE